MRIVVPPVVVDGRICRIVAPVEALLEVEEWVGEWWEPSSIGLTTASHAERASREQLLAHGVPEADHGLDEHRTPFDEIEAMIQRRDPERAASLEDVALPAQATRRVYPGNARFKRQAHDAPDAPPHARGGVARRATTPRAPTVRSTDGTRGDSRARRDGGTASPRRDTPP